MRAREPLVTLRKFRWGTGIVQTREPLVTAKIPMGHRDNARPLCYVCFGRLDPPFRRNGSESRNELRGRAQRKWPVLVGRCGKGHARAGCRAVSESMYGRLDNQGWKTDQEAPVFWRGLPRRVISDRRWRWELARPNRARLGSSQRRRHGLGAILAVHAARVCVCRMRVEVCVLLPAGKGKHGDFRPTGREDWCIDVEPFAKGGWQRQRRTRGAL
jgi:hypothetical protein